MFLFNVSESQTKKETHLLDTSGKLEFIIHMLLLKQEKKRKTNPLICPEIPHSPVTPSLCFRAVLHQIEGIGAITPAYLKPPKCVEQVAHNALLLLFGSRSQDGRFHNAFKWHITGRSLSGLPRTISPGAKEEQQAAARTFFNKEKEGRGKSRNAQCGIVNHLLTIESVC